MSNPFFKFKQFTVYHDRCAMKVGSDGVLLGAWADVTQAATILDAGTGSGLIALMLAQRSDARIDAIDTVEDAVEQATINVNNSPWAERISVIHCALQQFSPPSGYDLIVSNPPYFIDSLKAPELSRNTARHTDTLTHAELIDCSIPLLNQAGRLCLILPVAEGEALIQYAVGRGLSCTRQVSVFPVMGSSPKRLLIELSLRPVDTTVITTLTLEQSRHCYTDEFTDLVKDFYLKL